MSHLQYYAYPGVGERNRKQYHYSQAVRIDNRIECSGQGGWDPKTGKIPSDHFAEIDQAFENVQLALQDAGGKGWEQVYKVHVYTLVMTDESTAKIVSNFRKWMPNHQPLWTLVGVSKLGEEDMKFEIEVVAVDEK